MGSCFGKSAKLAHASSGQFSVEKRATENTESKQQNQSDSVCKTILAMRGQSSNLRSFTFSDLKNATRNFRSDSLLGEGGFGYVFKGWIDEQTFAPCRPGTGLVVAVKKLKAESVQGHREWLTEVNYLGLLPQIYNRARSTLPSKPASSRSPRR